MNSDYRAELDALRTDYQRHFKEWGTHPSPNDLIGICEQMVADLERLVEHDAEAARHWHDKSERLSKLLDESTGRLLTYYSRDRTDHLDFSANETASVLGRIKDEKDS